MVNSLHFNAVTNILLNRGLFVHEEKRLSFQSYYEAEWKLIPYNWFSILYFNSSTHELYCNSTKSYIGKEKKRKRIAPVQPLANIIWSYLRLLGSIQKTIWTDKSKNKEALQMYLVCNERNSLENWHTNEIYKFHIEKLGPSSNFG